MQVCNYVVTKMQVPSVSCDEEVCKYATTYLLKCRYGAYHVMKKYASMQLCMYLIQARRIPGDEEVCKYATTYVLKCRYGAYPVMKKYASMQLRMYLNVGTERI